MTLKKSYTLTTSQTLTWRRTTIQYLSQDVHSRKGITQEMILTYDDWDRREEYNCYSQEVGPCRKDVGCIEPDKEDLQFKRNWDKDGMDDDFAKQRESFRKYKRPSFSLPKTLQRDFYSDTLTDLLQLDCP